MLESYCILVYLGIVTIDCDLPTISVPIYFELGAFEYLCGC